MRAPKSDVSMNLSVHYTRYIKCVFVSTVGLRPGVAAWCEEQYRIDEIQTFHLAAITLDEMDNICDYLYVLLPDRLLTVHPHDLSIEHGSTCGRHV